jgi:hypothetical protein
VLGPMVSETVGINHREEDRSAIDTVGDDVSVFTVAFTGLERKRVEQLIVLSVDLVQVI